MENSTLETAATLAQRHGVDHKTVAAILERAKIGPVHSFVQGTRTVRLFDVQVASKAIEDHKASSTRAGVPQTRGAAPDLAPVADRLAELRRGLDDAKAHFERELAQRLLAVSGDLHERLDTIEATCSKLVEQNVLLLRALNDQREHMSDQLAALREIVLRMPAPSPEPQAQEAAAAPVAAAQTPAPDGKPKRMRIAIVGLLNNQRALIEREFGEAFDIRFFQSDDAKGRSFTDALQHCEMTLAMTAFINHGIDATVKAAGGKLVRIGGGMSSLRERLTAIWLEAAEGKKVAA